jgi:hypothetical protein
VGVIHILADEATGRNCVVADANSSGIADLWHCQYSRLLETAPL